MTGWTAAERRELRLRLALLGWPPERLEELYRNMVAGPPPPRPSQAELATAEAMGRAARHWIDDAILAGVKL